MSNSLWPHGLCSPSNSPGENTGVGSLSLLQRVFPTQRSNAGFPHFRQILYQLSHKRSPLKRKLNNKRLLLLLWWKCSIGKQGYKEKQAQLETVSVVQAIDLYLGLDFQYVDWFLFSSVQLLSHVWLCKLVDCCCTPDFPVLHQLLEFAQTHIHWVNNAMQPSHPLSSPSPPAFNLSQHPVSQFFTSGGHSIWASASASVLPINIQDWWLLGLAGLISLQSKGLSRVLCNTTVQNHQWHVR